MQSSLTDVAHDRQPPPDSAPEFRLRILNQEQWKERQQQHRERLNPWVDAQLTRLAHGEKHPIYDFLFDYNNLRPTHLRHWHPGLGTVLTGEQAKEFLSLRYYRRLRDGIGVDSANFPGNRLDSVRWILQLLEGCRDRPPQFGCFGLHEWAMVYRSPDVRHSGSPLRFTPDRLAEVVESLPIRCSHFDAFRFFTPEAQPRNKLQPTRSGQLEMEQRGCLHVNMDLFKWAHKLTPWTPSELIADTFLLAARIREIDMRASPYDFSDLGFEPIPIESPAGRAQYEEYQAEFTALGIPLRDQLIDTCQRILQATN